MLIALSRLNKWQLLQPVQEPTHGQRLIEASPTLVQGSLMEFASRGCGVAPLQCWGNDSRTCVDRPGIATPTLKRAAAQLPDTIPDV